MLTMKSLSYHLAPATQRDVTVWQRAMIHLEEKKPLPRSVCRLCFKNCDTYTMKWPAEKLRSLQTGTCCRYISRLTDSWKTSSTSCWITLVGNGRMVALCWDSQASRMELRVTLRWARSSHMLSRRLFRWSLNWTGWVMRVESHYNSCGARVWWYWIKNDSIVSEAPTWFWGRWKSTDQ